MVVWIHFCADCLVFGNPQVAEMQHFLLHLFAGVVCRKFFSSLKRRYLTTGFNSKSVGEQNPTVWFVVVCLFVGLCLCLFSLESKLWFVPVHTRLSSEFLL